MYVPYDKGAQILGARWPWRLNFEWCVFLMRLASCYAPGTYSLEVASRFLEKLVHLCRVITAAIYLVRLSSQKSRVRQKPAKSDHLSYQNQHP